MTVAGFILLLVSAIVGVTLGAHFAEQWTAPGLERTLMVAVIAAAVMFPAALLGERLGWIRGRLELFRGGGRRTGDGEQPASGTAAGSDRTDAGDGDRRP